MTRKIILYSFLAFVGFSFAYMKYYDMNINDVGLKVLSWVKKIKGDAVDINQIGSSDAPKIQHGEWDTLLQKHVTPKGNVNYQGFLQDSIAFQKYLDNLSQHPPGSNWSDKDQIAYWINAYNAFTVKLIIDHYPLKSIKDIGDGLTMIGSPWDMKFFKIGNTDFDLNTIEHEILRKQFNEPRIHFAINCASFSCPKLRNQAFNANDLENQLDEQARDFINNPDKNLISKDETKLSKIFDWFQSDFKKERNLLDYIKQYNANLNTQNEIEYIDYDWSLNE